MRFLPAVAVIASVMVLGAAGTAQATQFGPTVKLSSSQYADGPVAAVGESGDVAVVAREPGGLLIARHASGTDMATWEREQLPINTGNSDVVVTPAGVTVAAFAVGDTAMVAVAPRGRTFGAPVAIASPSVWYQPLDLTVLASGAVVLARGRSSRSTCCGSIDVAVMRPGDTRFGKPRAVFRGSLIDMSLAADGSGALMTWRGAPVQCKKQPTGCARVLRARRLDRLGRAQGPAVRLARDGGLWHETIGEPGERALVAWMPHQRVHSCRPSGQPVHCVNEALAPAFTNGWARLVLGPAGTAALSFGAYEPRPGSFATLDSSNRWSALRSLPEPVVYSTFLRDPGGSFLAVDPGDLSPGANGRVFTVGLRGVPLAAKTLDWPSYDEATNIVAAVGNARIAVIASTEFSQDRVVGLNAVLAESSRE